MSAVIISLLPIAILLILLIVLKVSAMKASAIAFIASLLIFIIYFRPGITGIAISMSKGFALALFVVMIIWGAMFLYNLVNESGALHVINKNMENLIKNRFMQFILLSWIFSAFLQGIAGFGVPVIVVVPLLIGLGFDPVASAAAVLVGHSWAISFGSMGSSIYAIDMVTATPVSGIVVYMSIFGMIAMFCTGISVCFIYGGRKHLVKGFPYVLILTVCMSVALYIMARLEMISVIGLLTGLTGLICGYAVYKLRLGKGERINFYRTEINLFQAILPYLCIVVLSLVFYVLNPKWIIQFDFPGYVTGLGRAVPAEDGYVTFNILKFPFTIILIASIISMVVYKKKRVLDTSKVKAIINITVKKCVTTTLTIVFLLNMAVIMMDSGMIDHIASALVNLGEEVYPIVSPFIGLLGAFVTGSNTNSNVIFGNLQETAANAIGISTAVICAVQSIGASVGGGIGPTTVSLGATAAQIQGEESRIYKKTLVPICITAAILGIFNWIVF